MLILMAALAALFLFSRKAGEPSGQSMGPTPAEAAATWQQAAAAGSPVAQQIQQQHQEAWAISGVAGSTAASAVAMLTTWTAATATGIGAIVVAAAILFDVLRGTAHLTANDFINRFQNPFHSQLGHLIDRHDARMADGTETLEAAQETYNAIVFLWDQFQIAANRYAEQNADAALVVKQGFHTLNGPNGLPGFPDGFINFMLRKLQGEIHQLAGGNPLSMYAGTF